jgi:hypothetical protein
MRAPQCVTTVPVCYRFCVFTCKQSVGERQMSGLTFHSTSLDCAGHVIGELACTQNCSLHVSSP